MVFEQLEDGYLMDPPEGCPEGIYDIMTDCWCYEPSGRPPFFAIKSMLARSFGMCMTLQVFLVVLLLMTVNNDQVKAAHLAVVHC